MSDSDKCFKEKKERKRMEGEGLRSGLTDKVHASSCHMSM